MVKFMKHCIKNTENGAKAKVWYCQCHNLDGKSFIFINAKEYGHDLEMVLDFAENDTDTMTDYFDKSHAKIYEGDPMYADALAMCMR